MEKLFFKFIKTSLYIGKKIKRVCESHKVKFIINDDPWLTKKLNADGCHLGQKDMNILNARKILKNKIIVTTCQNSKKIVKKATSTNYDMVFASRYENRNSGSEDDTWVTFIGNKIFTLIGKIFFGLPISDILYTYVLCDTKKTKKLKLKSNDFRFCVELPIKAIKKNYRTVSYTHLTLPTNREV